MSAYRGRFINRAQNTTSVPPTGGGSAEDRYELMFINGEIVFAGDPLDGMYAKAPLMEGGVIVEYVYVGDEILSLEDGELLVSPS